MSKRYCRGCGGIITHAPCVLCRSRGVRPPDPQPVPRTWKPTPLPGAHAAPQLHTIETVFNHLQRAEW